MSKEYVRMLQETLVSAGCLYMIFEAIHYGHPITASILALVVGVVNTLTAAEVYRVLQELQAENREDYTESQE